MTDHEIQITQAPSGRPNPVELNETPDKLEIPVICAIGARDTAGHALRYHWECGMGKFNDPSAASPTWTQPAYQPHLKRGYEVKITCTVTCAQDPTVSAQASYLQKVRGAQMVSGAFYRAFYESNPASGSEYFGTYVRKPWSGLLVVITTPEGKQIRARTGANGSFEVDVDTEGTYVVEVEDCRIFSKEYSYRVTVPDGEVGEQTLQDDRAMYDWARLASGYKMLQASQLLQNAGWEPKDINGLSNITAIRQSFDWSQDFRQYADELLKQWTAKRWKYITCQGQPRDGGADLNSAIWKSLRDSLDNTPAASAPPQLVTEGGGVVMRSNGAFMKRSLRPNEAVDCGAGRFVQNSEVLYLRDDEGVVVYVLEGLVLEYGDNEGKPIAGAITNDKITHNANAAPRVEPFSWAEAESVWQSGRRYPGEVGPKQGLVFGAAMDADVYAYAYLNWNRTNFGKMTNITAGYHPQGGEKRIYLQFPLPQVERVGQATLKLYQYHVTGASHQRLAAYRVLEPWQEGSGKGRGSGADQAGEISWVNQPRFATTPETIVQPPREAGQWLELDLTGLVNLWLAGTANYGVVVKVAEEPNPTMPNTWHGFRSRECEEAAHRPVLELTGAIGGPAATDPQAEAPPRHGS